MSKSKQQKNGEQTFGEFVTEKRAERGLSLKDLGKATGVSAQYLHDIEKDRRRPSQECLGRMAEALGVPAAQLEAVGGRATSAVSEYLRRHPECAVAVENLLGRAEARGFAAEDWDSIIAAG